MKKIYPHLYLSITIATIAFLIFSNQPLCAQPGQASHTGVIRIKVTEALAAKLERRKFSQSSTGEVITGEPGLDEKSRKFKVKRFKRVFRPGGKNEARHRKHGLHLWYELTMDKGSSVSEAVRAYRADKEIMRAEPVYKKTVNGSGVMDETVSVSVIDESVIVIINIVDTCFYTGVKTVFPALQAF